MTSNQSSRFSGLSRLGRFSVVWPLLVIALSIAWAFYVLGRLPGAAIDLIERGWPVVLVIVGLMLILGRRIRLGNLLALLASGVLVGVIAMTAYGQQASRERTDNTIPFNYPVASEVTSVKINASTLLTKLDIVADTKPAISGQFMGSRASTVTLDYKADGSTGTFTLDETQGSGLPLLESVGRGTLALHLPTGVSIEEITITGRDGDIQFDATDLTVKNLSITTSGGNLTVTLPAKSALIGDLKTGRGDVTAIVPKSIAANIALHGGGANGPEYNQGDYTLDINHVLIPKHTEGTPSQITIDTPGKITIQ